MNLLVVDDEPSILNGLISMIRRESNLSIDIVSADGGVDALAKLQNFKPDLVITDVYMPEINGFELIEEIKRRQIYCRFAILTGYDDFELVRTALRMKTIEYLVKPVNREELIQLLSKVYSELAEEREEYKKQQILKIREMMLYNIPYEEILMDQKGISGLFPYPYMTGVVIQFRKIIDSKVIDNIKRRISIEGFQVAEFESLSRQQVVLLYCNHHLFSKELCEEFYSTIVQWKSDESCFGVGISSNISDLNLIHDLYVSASREAFLYQYSSDVHFQPHNDLGYKINNIANVFENGNQHSIALQVHSYIKDILKVAQPTGKEIQDVFLIIMADINTYLQDVGAEWNKDTSLLLDGIENLNTIQQLEEKAISIVIEVIRYLKSSKKEINFSESVLKVKGYIESNYKTEISLEMIAEVVHLHPNYISMLFKKETGTNFRQYLHNYRISVAKNIIIQNPDVAFETIAHMVGYDNPRQFFKMFKKICNITPGQFRELL